MSILNMVYGSGGGGSVDPVYKGEYIEYIMQADSSGNLYVPTGGLSTTGTANCPYSWKISVDGGSETTYTGTGSNGSKITLSGYTANNIHTITIKPTTEEYGWARAYSWYNGTVKTYIYEIIYDSSYMGYAVSATNTGDYFRSSQYYGCTNLRNTFVEYMPDTVTTIGNFFMNNQYYGDTKLSSISDEYLSNSITSIGTWFRANQFFGCTALKDSAKESLPNSVTSIGERFRIAQYRNCTGISAIRGWKDLNVGGTLYRYGQYNGCTTNKIVYVDSNVGYNGDNGLEILSNSYVTGVAVPSAYVTTFKNTNNYPRVGITDTKFVGY